MYVKCPKCGNVEDTKEIRRERRSMDDLLNEGIIMWYGGTCDAKFTSVEFRKDIYDKIKKFVDDDKSNEEKTRVHIHIKCSNCDKEMDVLEVETVVKTVFDLSNENIVMWWGGAGHADWTKLEFRQDIYDEIVKIVKNEECMIKK